MNFGNDNHSRKSNASQKFKDQLNRILVTFTLAQNDQVLVTSVDGFRSPEEDNLSRALFSHQCQKLTDNKYLIPSLVLYEKIQKEVSENVGQFIPRNILKCFEPMPLTIRIQYNPSFYVHYREEERNYQAEQIIPPQIYGQLYQFQKEGIQFCIKRFGRAIIGDEMGVGKTIQSLMLCKIYYDVGPILIICPSLLIYNWRDEVLKWLQIDISEIQIIDKKKFIIDKVKDLNIYQNVKISIISYDLATHHHLSLNHMKMAIADEAHHLKSGFSQRSKSIVPLLRGMKHVLLLTGTPALARPKELYNLFNIVRPDIFSNFYDFANRYCDPQPSQFSQGLSYEGSSNSSELHQVILTLMIRRKKVDVLHQLPKKVRVDIALEGDTQYMRQISAIKKLKPGIFGIFEEKNPEKTQFDRPLIMKCYKLTGLAKAHAISQFIHQTYDEHQENKFIVFCHHKEVMDIVEQNLKKAQIQNIRIDGDVNNEVRHQRVTSFQNDSSVKIALLSLTAASVGITLTAAQTVIFGELHWTPGIMKQAEDRAHRIGQIFHVNCIYLYCKGTLDDRILELIDEKENRLGYILDGEIINSYSTQYEGSLQVNKQHEFNPLQSGRQNYDQEIQDLQQTTEKKKKAKKQDQGQLDDKCSASLKQSQIKLDQFFKPKEKQADSMKTQQLEKAKETQDEQGKLKVEVQQQTQEQASNLDDQIFEELGKLNTKRNKIKQSDQFIKEENILSLSDEKNLTISKLEMRCNLKKSEQKNQNGDISKSLESGTQISKIKCLQKQQEIQSQQDGSESDDIIKELEELQREKNNKIEEELLDLLFDIKKNKKLEDTQNLINDMHGLVQDHKDQTVNYQEQEDEENMLDHLMELIQKK